MPSKHSRDAYRARLRPGCHVYMVDAFGREALTVKKGVVLDPQAMYPYVNILNGISSAPVMKHAVSKSPRALFTEREVIDAVIERDLSLLARPLSVDQMLEDPITNRDLTAVLGGATMGRMIEDEIQHPGDPER